MKGGREALDEGGEGGPWLRRWMKGGKEGLGMSAGKFVGGCVC